MIRKETFTEISEAVRRRQNNRKAPQQELDFHSFVLDKINDDTIQGVNIFDGVPGLGKSTFLSSLVQSWILDNPFRGLLVLTDSIDRLEDLLKTDDAIMVRKIKQKVALVTADNRTDGMIEARTRPILLISTQKFTRMKVTEVPQLLDYWIDGQEYCRDTIIFDEAPTVCDDAKLTIRELNDLHTFVNAIPDTYNQSDKDWIMAEYDELRKQLIDLIKNLEGDRKQNIYLYYNWGKPFREHALTSDDRRFFKILEDNKPKEKDDKTIRFLYQMSFRGAIYQASKKTNASEYDKGFIMESDGVFKIDAFTYNRRFWTNYEQNIRVFIFDGTAKTSKIYPYYWNIYDCSQFRVPLDFLTVHLVDINASKTALTSDKKKELRLAKIKSYLGKLKLDPNDTLMVTHSKLVKSGEFKPLGFDSNKSNIAYFGNVKGKNEYNNRHTFIQLGLMRESTIRYLIYAMQNDKQMLKYITSNNESMEQSIQKFDSLLNPSDNRLDDYILPRALADFLQNLYRIKVREIENREPIDVYLFTKVNDNLIESIRESLPMAKVEADQLKIKDFKEELQQMPLDELKFRVANSKGKYAKAIYDWLSVRAIGEMFKVKTLQVDLGISKGKFYNTLKDNLTLNELLKRMKTSKKGYYKVI
ncbi:hypothetical protein P261_00434 [Lachnospiraceae bacterium TWA4]|nr:hypothetical protein P261_00434 [Lachnospiraceae bacterium TWA4]